MRTGFAASTSTISPPVRQPRRPHRHGDVDAVGPQSITFRQLVDAVRTAVGSPAVVVPVPGPVLTGMSRGLSLILRDTLLTRDEYHAMAGGLADPDAPSTGSIAITEDQRTPHRAGAQVRLRTRPRLPQLTRGPLVP